MLSCVVLFLKKQKMLYVEVLIPAFQNMTVLDTGSLLVTSSKNNLVKMNLLTGSYSNTADVFTIGD